MYDVIPVLIGIGGLEHSKQELLLCYIKDKDELEELVHRFSKVRQSFKME